MSRSKHDETNTRVKKELLEPSTQDYQKGREPKKGQNLFQCTPKHTYIVKGRKRKKTF